jgi:uncharacterized membrane protein YidH (DUF202 family)
MDALLIVGGIGLIVLAMRRWERLSEKSRYR